MYTTGKPHCYFLVPKPGIPLKSLSLAFTSAGYGFFSEAASHETTLEQIPILRWHLWFFLSFTCKMNLLSSFSPFPVLFVKS